MGNLFSRLFKKKKPIQEVIDTIEEKSIYKRIEKRLELINTHGIVIDSTVALRGRFRSCKDDMVGFIDAFKEVNELLRKQKHLEGPLFHVTDMKDVYLDEFLFTHKGKYLSDPKQTFDILKLQIGEYLVLMKEADKEEYGYREHNHRQLYHFTTFISDFLDVLLRSFLD